MPAEPLFSQLAGSEEIDMSLTALTVSQVNSYVKQVLDGDKNLKAVFVCGEISNFKGHYSSGHLYFSLKDAKASLSAVMFNSAASRLRFRPENGMKVIVTGRITIYEATGQYQLYVESMQPDGKGAIALAYEQLKNRLSAEGLFDDKYKKELPVFPKRIGVITSATGAVIRDILNVSQRRCPMTEICLYPSSVQGERAAQELIEGIRYFDGAKDVDVIIIGRGGGSFEDLNCFNDEALVRAIFDCTIPVISAVGHETDFTLCDFVSDRRAPTPSAAAELAVPDRAELAGAVADLLDRIQMQTGGMLALAYQDIDRLRDSIYIRSPERQLENELLSIRLLSDSIRISIENKLSIEQMQTDSLANSINAMSPIRLLQKGYSIASKNGKAVRSASELETGQKIEIRLSDGSAECSVLNVNKRGE